MRRIRVLTCAVTLVAVLAGTVVATPSAASEQPNVVVRWNETALNTVLADSARRTPSAASLYVAIAQASVYDAVMAIEGTH